MQTVKAIAWRREHGYAGRGGVVVVFNDTVAGWMNELRHPEHWEPGAIAVDELGHTWRAVGGDAKCGATLWMPTSSATWRRMKMTVVRDHRKARPPVANTSIEGELDLHYRYAIEPRSDHMGGGWLLRFFAGEEEVGGGIFAVPAYDTAECMKWWNRLSEDNRADWLTQAIEPTVTEAYNAYLTEASLTDAETMAQAWLEDHGQR
ncbi:hypothetical protein [Pseudoduganella lutea]|uniref:hypothetical protein n=1 Tax=Pseudoduganella lutea TaxID=321985 RepID=UPI001E4DD00A|nr:hypothetical protein [Pseudoduganella lutea]